MAVDLHENRGRGAWQVGGMYYILSGVLAGD